MAQTILGLSCFFHDSAVAAIEDGRIAFAIQEERLSRRKHDPGLPVRSVERALEFMGWQPPDVDTVVFYENPDWKLQRIQQQFERARPEHRAQRTSVLSAFLQNKYPIASRLRREFGFAHVVCGEHHRSHASAAFYTSPFDRAVVVTIDGVGESETAAVFLGEGNTLTRVRSLRFPHSLGLFYSVFTQYLGFEVNEGEYKVMGLAPYGTPAYLDALVPEVLRLDDDGGFTLNLTYFDFESRERHYTNALSDHLGIAPRAKNGELTQPHCDLAASVQAALEAGVMNLLSSVVRDYRCRDVCMGGGVALNCTANARAIRELGIRLHVHPAAGDAGGALGAALSEAARSETDSYRPAFSPYLGVAYAERDIAGALAQTGMPHRRIERMPAEIARRLADGEVVGVLHGRDEWGPRALGARSILADPRRAGMKEHLNAKIKFREEFRPFAPVVLEERYAEYFETLAMAASPHMLYTHKAQQPARIAAAVHADGTSRVQTVNREQNAHLYDILQHFERLTGVPVLINTSFNLRGEPIVSSPADALRTFAASDIDCVALDDHLVVKDAAHLGRRQPPSIVDAATSDALEGWR
jgi:carbamoyltransferase